ncbi:MAG: recombinase family protein [Ruminiclostridium sp.]
MNVKTTKHRALLLLREPMSKQVTGDENRPLPVQLEKCEEVCQNNGWEIIDCINEHSSAYKNSAEKRKTIQKIRQLAIRKEFDILVVFKMDRICRTGIETLNFIMWLRKAGIRIYSVTEGELC